jgi:HK97 family phage prohead protease
MPNLLEYKSILTSTKDAITDVNEKDGIIEGYFAVFNNKDSDKDVIRKGFFTKTLQENHKRIKHLYQHDPWKPLSGTKNGNLILEQDSYGLKYKSIVSKTSYGRDVILLHVDGVIDENSIGFITTQSKELKNEDGRELIEGILFEGSSVTWGANELALNTSAKSLKKDELFKKMDVVTKAIRNGKYENEDLFDSLDLYLKQLQTIINELTTKAVEEAPKPEKFKEFAEALTIFNKTLIH